MGKKENEATEKSTALATTDGAGGVPAYMGSYAGVGGEDIDVSGIPFLKLLQGSSNEVKNRVGDAGDFYISTSGENLGKSIRFVVLMAWRSCVLWPRKREEVKELRAKLKELGFDEAWMDKNDIPRDNPRKFPTFNLPHAALADWQMALAEWRSEGERRIPPFAAETFNFIVALLDDKRTPKLMEPALATLSHSSAKAGDGIAKMLKAFTQKGGPVFGMTFEAGSTQGKDSQGNTYCVWAFKREGFINEADLKGCLAAHEQLKKVAKERIVGAAMANDTTE